MKRIWGWELATYLFLGGLGGGMLTFAAILAFFVEPGIATNGMLVLGVLVAVLCLAFGTFLLVFELGQWPAFERAFVAKKAVIKWGATVLSISMIFAVIWLLWNISWFDFVQDGGILPCQWFSNVCLGISALAGACVMVYTGVLLSSLKARPFWNTPALPCLFTISALSTGAALLSICLGHFPFPNSWMNPDVCSVLGCLPDNMTTCAGWVELKEELTEWLHHIDAVLIIAELLTINLFVLLQMCASNVYASRVARRWVYGNWAGLYWGCMICCGLVIPFILNISGVHVLGIASSVIALFGGLLLRFMVLYSVDRRLAPGEEKYYTHIHEDHQDFMDYWLPGRQYFEIVNADQFDDMPVVVERPKTPLKNKFVWAVTKDHGHTSEPNPAYPTWRQTPADAEPYKVFRKGYVKE